MELGLLRFIFKKFFSQHHTHKQIFNSFSTDLYLIFCQLNLNSIVELYWIGFQFNAIVHENQFLFFIGWSSLAVRNNLEPKYCLGYEEQCQLSVIIMLKKNEPMTLLTNFVTFLNQKMGNVFAFFFLESIQIILLFYITYLEKKKKNHWCEQLKYELNNTWKMMLIKNEIYIK
jgi:hypothetical protein